MDFQLNLELSFFDFFTPEKMVKSKTSTDVYECRELLISCFLPNSLSKLNMDSKSLLNSTEAERYSGGCRRSWYNFSRMVDDELGDSISNVVSAWLE